MFVRRSLRFLVLPSSSSTTRAAAVALLLLVAGCAGDGGSPRPTPASEPRPDASGASAGVVTTPGCDAVTDATSCSSAPTPAPASSDTASSHDPAPYGWRLHRAPRRAGGTPAGISWRTAGQNTDGISIASATSSDQQRTPMVMSAAPVPVSFQVESDGDAAPLAGLIPATATSAVVVVAEPAPAVQTVALVSPSAPQQPVEEASAVVTATAADPARASEAIVAYASVATKPAATTTTTTMMLSPTLSPPSEDSAAAEQAIADAERPEWIINVATHANAEDAKRHVDQLVAAGFKATARQETVRGRASYRVVIESLPSESAAQSALADLNSKYGNGSAWSMRKR